VKQNLVIYRTKPDRAEENQRLVEAVFRELHATMPGGLRYASMRLADDTFVHVVEMGEDGNVLLETAAFQRFLAEIRDRCIDPPRVNAMTIVGNYRMLEAAPAMAPA
jgi:quinol monooxygenase YgiN